MIGWNDPVKVTASVCPVMTDTTRGLLDGIQSGTALEVGRFFRLTQRIGIAALTLTSGYQRRAIQQYVILICLT